MRQGSLGSELTVILGGWWFRTASRMRCPGERIRDTGSCELTTHHESGPTEYQKSKSSTNCGFELKEIVRRCISPVCLPLSKLDTIANCVPAGTPAGLW